ncbi:MAG: methyltransferase domain-containing protein [Elusimicrobiota bacterium]|nr:methyltransferase domain-containing protein [Elusimicrobiota bacterium]
MKFQLGQDLIDVARGKKKMILIDKETAQAMKKVEKLTAQLKSKKACVKLHVACGKRYKEGWINIDNDPKKEIEKLDLLWDARKPLPFDNNSVDFIYNEHFLQCLTVKEARSVIKDFMRVLKPKGVIRIAMPDIQTAIKRYSLEDTDWKQLKDSSKSNMVKKAKTKCELLNMDFRACGHKWLYDWSELEMRIKESGYKNIKQCALGKSEYKQLIGLETRGEASNLIAEIVK